MSSTLTITIHKAILSKDLCIFGTMNPYYIVSLSDSKSYKGKVRESEGKYPLWNETNSFVYNNEGFINIAVFHDTKEIGNGSISINDVNNSSNNLLDKDVVIKKGSDVGGKVQVTVKLEIKKPSINVPDVNISNSSYVIGKSSTNNHSWNNSGNINNANPNCAFSQVKSSSTFNSISNSKSNSFNNNTNNTSSNTSNISWGSSSNNNTSNINSSSICNNNYNNNNNSNNSNNRSSMYSAFTQGTANFYKDHGLDSVTNYNNNSCGIDLNNNDMKYTNKTNINVHDPSKPAIINNHSNNSFNNNPNHNNRKSLYADRQNPYLGNNYLLNIKKESIITTGFQNYTSKLKSISILPIGTNNKWHNSLTYNKKQIFFQQNSNQIFYFDNDRYIWLINPTNHFTPKFSRSAELPDGSFIQTGGEVNGVIVSNTNHYFNGEFILKENMNHPRKAHSTVYNKGNVYVFGGFGSKEEGTIFTSEKFDCNKNKWEYIQNMPHCRAYGSCMVYGTDFIFLIGGYTTVRRNGVSSFCLFLFN